MQKVFRRIAMCRISLAFTIFCFLVTLVSCHIREKRSGISDQRLAEIETLLAMENSQRGHNNVAYGLIDPLTLGKRKRSHKGIIPMQLEEDFPNDSLRESRLKLPYFQGESLMYPRRLPEKIYNRFRVNDLENRELQADDVSSK